MLDLSLEELVQQIKSQQVTAESVMTAVYDNIDQYEEQLHAYHALLPRDEALAAAKLIDQKAQKGEPLGKLAGIPTSLKDNICIKDSRLKTSCGSKLLENFESPYNATVVEKLQQEDAIIIGKTNMDEFAMGSSTENSAYGVTKNPWDLNRVPGGSSGGAAVTVSMRMALLALGSDTGGSIRQPASFCGVTGMKPSYGFVSRYGLVAYGSSLDQIGCLAKSSEDCAYGLSVISGFDPKDSTSAQESYLAQEGPALADLKFCLPTEYIQSDALDDSVKASLNHMIEQLQKAGATVEERSIPSTEYLIPTYYILAFAEASSNLGRFDGIRYGVRQQKEESLESLYHTTRSLGFGTEVKRRIMLGTFVLSAGYYDQYYGKAGKARTLIEKEIESILTEFDFIVGPVSPFPAFELGEKTEDPLSMYLVDLYSVLANLTRMPAISIPGPLSDNGMPIGLQLLGPKFSDQRLLATASQIQKLTEFHQQKPALLK